MKKKSFFSVLMVGVVFISCSGDDDNVREPAPYGNLLVNDQVYGNGTVTVDRAEISKDGWIAVYRFDTQREELVGYTFVEAGIHNDIVIELDENAGVVHEMTLQALLHLDTNNNGIFDWGNESNVDIPIKVDNQEIPGQFSTMITAENWISIENQPVGSGPFNDILNVFNLNLGLIQDLVESDKVWLVAYNDLDGSPGDEIGGTDLLSLTSHDHLTVYIYEGIAVEETVWLVLHNDEGSAPGSMVWDPENEDFVKKSITILER